MLNLTYKDRQGVQSKETKQLATLTLLALFFQTAKKKATSNIGAVFLNITEA